MRYKRRCNWCGKKTEDYISTPLGVCCDKCHSKIINKAIKNRKDTNEKAKTW